MKLYILLITVFISIFVTAQKQTIQSNMVATYDYDYIFNGQKNTEEAVLLMDTKSAKSMFQGSNQYVYDSIKANSKKEITLEVALNYDSAFNEIEFLQDNKFTVYDRIAGFNLKYNEPTIIKWDIMPDKKKIGSINVQKAVCNAYGRSWIAWFSPDYPFPYGPYKFRGLPGLIVEVSDSAGIFRFSMKKFKPKKIIRDLSYLAKAKPMDKSKVNQFKYDYEVNPENYGVIYTDPNERRSALKSNSERLKKTPPIDIQYRIDYTI